MVKVTLKDVEKKFGNELVIPKANLEILDNEFLVLVGPSGCGKSTLLNLIAGLEYLTTGQIFFDDVDITLKGPRDRNIAMVFQSYALYPHLNTFENLAFGLRLAKMPKEEINKRVENAAEILQITELMEKKPKQMSGGQRQRVALGRAIVRNPSVFLLDEPLSNLDAKLRVEMRAEIIRLQKKLQTTLVYVTHDQVEAMSMADRIVILDKGVIQQIGSPFDVYYYPKNLFVAGFIGSPMMNFLPGKLVQDGDTVAAEIMDLQIPLHGKKAIAAKEYLKSKSEVTIGIRPEHLFLGRSEDETFFKVSAELKASLGGDLSDESTCCKAEVLVIEHLGVNTQVTFEKDGQKFTVLMDGFVNAKMADNLVIRFYEHSIHLFDPETGLSPVYE